MALASIGMAPVASHAATSGTYDCPITEFGYTGYRMCGTGWTDKIWNDGHEEVFIIGVDAQIWDITTYTNGWRSLGGQARSGSWVGAAYDGYGNPTVITIGTDNATWCRSYTPSTWWDKWHKCAMRSDVIAKAQSWLTAYNGGQVPYSMTSYFRGWRQDCSGFVSMAWNTPTSEGGYNTDSLTGIAHRINWGDLRSGDIIGYLGPNSLGSAGHVMIFDKWADSGHTRYWVYEQASSAGGTAHRTHPIGYNGDSPGPYQPWRYNAIVDA